MSEDFEDDSEEESGPAAKPDKEPVPQELLDKALEDLRRIVKGNGIKPENITLQNFNGEILNFPAWEIFDIETETVEKRMPGKEGGEIAGSYIDAQQKIQSFVENSTKDRELRKQTAAMLAKRKDIGLGVENLFMRLDRLNKRFVIHEACSVCHASGKTLCSHCQGKGHIQCPQCHGQLRITCHACGGSQFINGPQGRQPCTTCHGQGQMPCTFCHQTGEISCPKCQRTGKMPCQHCAATGWNSHLFITKVRAKSRFDYEREDLPEDVPPFIDEYRKELVTENHVQAELAEDVKEEEALSRRARPSEYYILYHVHLPWGVIKFNLREQEITAKLAGYNPKLLDLPAVLTKSLAGPMMALSNAAQAKGDVARLIKKAIRARLIAESFLCTLSQSPQQARSAMQKNYPYGIEEQTLDNILVHAKKSLKRLTAKNKVMGFLGGALAAALLFASYFLSPLRTKILMTLGPEIPDIVPDLTILICGGGLITLLMQITSTHILRRTLGAIAGKKPIKAKPQESALWGYPGAVLIFAAVLYLAFIQNVPLPSWLFF